MAARSGIAAKVARSGIPVTPERARRTDEPVVREPDEGIFDRELLERLWRSLSRWAVPVMMAGAYALLAVTSETDVAGKSWMAVGFGFVLVVWFVFRALTETAALSRALSVGDTVRLFELAARYLPRKRRPADRAPFLVGRALAHQLRGEFTEALAALAEARPSPELQPLARAVRIGALVELGRPVDEAAGVEARTTVAPVASAVPVVPAARRSLALTWLAEAELAWRDHQLEVAAPLFARVIDDIRAGGATRAIAHVYAARIAETQGDPAAAARHRTAAATLATPDATWLRRHVVVGDLSPAPAAPAL